MAPKRGSTGAFYIPGLVLPVGEGRKSGMSAKSEKRVITFLPPPLNPPGCSIVSLDSTRAMGETNHAKNGEERRVNAEEQERNPVGTGIRDMRAEIGEGEHTRDGMQKAEFKALDAGNRYVRNRMKIRMVNHSLVLVSLLRCPA